MATTERSGSNERVSTASLRPARAPSPFVNEQHLSLYLGNEGSLSPSLSSGITRRRHSDENATIIKRTLICIKKIHTRGRNYELELLLIF